MPVAETEGIRNLPLQKYSFHQDQQVFNRHNSFLDPFTEMNAYTYIHMTFFTVVGPRERQIRLYRVIQNKLQCSPVAMTFTLSLDGPESVETSHW